MRAISRPFCRLGPNSIYASDVGVKILKEGSVKALKSVVEAAQLLGISPWTLRSYIRLGRIRPVRIGRRVLLREEDLERFITETVPSQEPSAMQAFEVAEVNNG